MDLLGLLGLLVLLSLLGLLGFPGIKGNSNFFKGWAGGTCRPPPHPPGEFFSSWPILNSELFKSFKR